MSEQGLSESENSPAVAGPDTVPGTAEANSPQEIDWQKRYVDTQEAYTKGQQEIADLRRVGELYEQLLTNEDPDVRRQVALELGYELDDGEQDPSLDPNEDPLGYMDERLGRIEHTLSAREQEQADAAYFEQMQAVVNERLDQLPGLDKADQDWVLAYAVNALPITEEGLPDLQGALQAFQAWETDRQRKWARTKQAPHFSPHGQSATEAPNLDDRQDRQDFIMRRMQEGDQAGY